MRTIITTLQALGRLYEAPTRKMASSKTGLRVGLSAVNSALRKNQVRSGPGTRTVKLPRTRRPGPQAYRLDSTILYVDI